MKNRQIDIAESVVNVLLDRNICFGCHSTLISFIESDILICSNCGREYLEGFCYSELDESYERVLIPDHIWPKSWRKEVENGLETGSSPEICGGI